MRISPPQNDRAAVTNKAVDPKRRCFPEQYQELLDHALWRPVAWTDISSGKYIHKDSTVYERVKIDVPGAMPMPMEVKSVFFLLQPLTDTRQIAPLCCSSVCLKHSVISLHSTGQRARAGDLFLMAGLDWAMGRVGPNGK